jgi:hypothetical protein
MNNLPDHQGKVFLIKHYHLGNPTFCDERKFAGEDINQSSQDEHISHQSGRAQFCKVTYEYKRQENNELHQDEVLDGNDFHAVRHGHDECLKMMSMAKLKTMC